MSNSWWSASGLKIRSFRGKKLFRITARISQFFKLCLEFNASFIMRVEFKMCYFIIIIIEQLNSSKIGNSIFKIKAILIIIIVIIIKCFQSSDWYYGWP
jgi:hypothetical protein